jgi:hypothetical protein
MRDLAAPAVAVAIPRATGLPWARCHLTLAMAAALSCHIGRSTSGLIPFESVVDLGVGHCRYTSGCFSLNE